MGSAAMTSAALASGKEIVRASCGKIAGWKMPAISEDLILIYSQSDGLALAELVRKGDVSPLALVEAAITLVERFNPQLNAVVWQCDALQETVARRLSSPRFARWE